MPLIKKILFLLVFISIFCLLLIAFYQLKLINPSKQSIIINTNQNTVQPTVKKDFESTLSIDYIKSLNINSKAPVIEQQLASGSNYKRFIASYYSENNKIYGLLTVPNTIEPANGYGGIIFIHGYIPPSEYKTEEKYINYVDSLAKAGFVVFKIDLRGHGNSQGTPSGTYFSNAYTIDALSAFSSLQKLPGINKSNIGFWGHSMAGNIVLRSMLVNNNIKAGVIWAGAVYSYADFAKYGLNDSSYVPRSSLNVPSIEPNNPLQIKTNEEILKFRTNRSSVDFNTSFWKSISLTNNINYLNKPLLINHALDDKVVSVNYSKDLVDVLKQNNKTFEYYEYQTGGHNIEGGSFTLAMNRTIDFFKVHLK